MRTARDIIVPMVNVSAVNGDVVPMIDVSMNNYVCLHFTGTWTGTVTVQGANDTTNYNTASVVNLSSGAVTTSITANGIYVVPTHFAFLRVRVTAYTSGTVTGSYTLGGGDVPLLISSLTATLTGSSNIVTPVTPTPHALTSAATTNATSVKASAGSLFSIAIDNVSASARYLKLYNKAAAPTVGTDVPILTIPIAAGAVAAIEFGALGKRFSTGIAYAITGAIAVADTTAIAAGDCHVTLDYV